MRKNTIIIIGVLLLGVLLLTGFIYNKNKIEEIKIENIVSVDNIKDSEGFIENIYQEESKNISEENINSLRKNITLNDLTLLMSGYDIVKDNNLLEVGKVFLSNIKKTENNKITENIIGGINYEEYLSEIVKIPDNLKRELSLEGTITDVESKNKIQSGYIYINGINFGSFSNGQINKKIIWPIGIEKFNIMVRAENYGDGFLSVNSINSEGSLLLVNIKLKKSLIYKNFDLSQETKISSNNTLIEFDTCSFINKNGICYNKPVTVKINHLTGDEANSNNQTINMNALTKEGEIVYLQSGGMAFVELITDEGELLQLDGTKTIKITYKVSNDDIINMADRLRGNGDKNGYWWYDKNNSIWQESDAEYSIDKENNTWSATIKKLY